MESWQPTASIANLHLRAQILRKIRDFFAQRHVLEVETPILSHCATTDPYLVSFVTQYHPAAHTLPQDLYLQTSPEFAMKRLLAAGSGAIYQICKTFRNEESGALHNAEFTMLEWYRPEFDHHALMDEVDELLQYILQYPKAQRFTYQQIFSHFLSINPHKISAHELANFANQRGLPDVIGFDHTDRDGWLQLLMTHFIEPSLGKTQPVFIYDFPASQAALAKIRQDEFAVAERFEVYIKGIELANGFHELTHAGEQQKRFLADNEKRRLLNLPQMPIDQHLLAALTSGMPTCAGVALGVDRLIMLAANAKALVDVMSFDVERA